MTSQTDRTALLLQLDDELLKGGVVLSEWCAFLVRESDEAFEAGAYLASLLTALAAIETFLRSEVSGGKKKRLVDLIEASGLDPQLIGTLSDLRLYRNKWVHVDDPSNDEELLRSPEVIELELESKAFAGIRALRRVVYSSPWV
jgi:hypothetical protein